MKNPSKIANKAKRQVVYEKYKQQKKKIKKRLREEKAKEVASLGENAPPKAIPRTIGALDLSLTFYLYLVSLNNHLLGLCFVYW